MKAGFFLLLSLTLLFLQCQSGKSNNNVSQPKKDNFVAKQDFTKKFDDIEITYSINLAESPKITISYEIKNTGAKNYIVFNQGHTNNENRDDVYIEEKGGIIEISQKAFALPTDINCPPTIAPIYPRGAVLPANGSLKGEAVIEEFRIHTPYDFCYKPSKDVLKFDKARFCLGVSENPNAAAKVDENGIITGRENLKEQKVLCSDEIKLK